MNLEQLDKESLLAVLRGIIATAKPLAPAAPVLPMEQVVREFLAAKEARHLRDRSLADYRSRLGFLKPLFASPVHSVTRADLEPLIFKPGQSGRTANGNRRAIYSLFEWCRKRKLLAFNPVEDIEISQVEASEPKIFTLDEVRALLREALGFRRGRLVPYFALGFFGGLRPKELSRLEWGTHISPQQKVVRVTGAVAKKRSKRVIEINNTLSAWLAACDGIPVVNINFRRNLDAVRRRAGFKGSYPIRKDARLKEWPDDGIRHTALSYYYALTQDDRATAYWAGNSPDVFHSHYKGLVSAGEVVDYWALLPGSV